MEDNEEYIGNNSEEVSGHSYNLLKVEYERCRQEVHDLKRKFHLNETMLQEVQEANELLERSLDQRISAKEKIICQTKERHRTRVKEYESIISNLEMKLMQQAQEIKELQQRVNRYPETECKAITGDQSVNSSFETDNISLRNRIDELLSILREEKKKSERAEIIVEELKIRCDELEYYSQSLKEQLDEKNQTLEEIRAELTLRRAQAVSLEIVPICESRKGNSLFAEVEDRRRQVMSKMNTLREKYNKIKRVCTSQIADIKMLRAEHIATLRKWENDTDHTLTDNEELIQKYKNRISDLESKLKSEINRNVDLKQFSYTDTSFSYFQSLLNAKKKETDELRIKVEDLCTKFLVQEETKINITKQLHYWQYKASTLEGQVRALQAELKLNRTDDAEYEILKEFENLVHESNDNEINYDEQFTSDQQYSKNTTKSPPLNSFKNQDVHCSVINPERYEIYDQSLDKQKSNHNDAAECRNVTPKIPCQFEHNQTKYNSSNELSNDSLSFAKNTIIKNSTSPQKSTVDSKYPVVYIPTNLNN